MSETQNYKLARENAVAAIFGAACIAAPFAFWLLGVPA